MGATKGRLGTGQGLFTQLQWMSHLQRNFFLRLVCPTANIGCVNGKGGVIINQIRQESGAAIKVDSSAAEGDACVISISTKEVISISIDVLDGSAEF